MQELRSCRQQPGETIEEYKANLDALYRKADLLNEYPAADKLRQFIGGLRPEIQEPVEIAAPINLTRAMTHAKAAEAAFSRNVPLSSYSLHKSYLARTDGTDPEIQKLKNDFQTFASEIKTLLQSKPVATTPPSKPATNN